MLLHQILIHSFDLEYGTVGMGACCIPHIIFEFLYLLSQGIIAVYRNT
uniref:Uncharacterized protein n=1 Tax=Arundo donax TaxID=35708 RepID=A0A0A9AUS0_ARUDO